MLREEAIDIIKCLAWHTRPNEKDVEQAIKTLTTKNDLGVDLISRADAIQAIQDKAKKLSNEDTINGLCGAVAILFDLPPVTPIRPKGHWISRPHIYGVVFCSECGFELRINNTNYCPNCGSYNGDARIGNSANMREVEE